jgi:hypothetical protein
MAQKIKISWVDDLDGGSAEETISFTLDGTRYEIDLSADNAQRLREALRPWVEAASPMNERRRRPPGLSRLVIEPHNAPIIREWAREHGLDVPTRGRLPDRLVYAYLREHGELTYAGI